MADSEAGRIFVGGISWKADEESLANFFSTFGKVIECRIIMDKNTKKSKGYGFITFEDPEAAEKVKTSNNLYFLGKMMNVGDAVRKEGASNGGSQGGRGQPRGDYGAYENGGNSGYYNQRNASEYYQQGQFYPQANQYYNYSQGGYSSQYSPSGYQQDQAAWQPMPGSNASSSSPSSGTSTSNQQIHSPASPQQTTPTQQSPHAAQGNTATANLTPQQQQQVYQNLAALQQLQHLQQLQQLQQLQYQQRLFMQQNPQFQQLYQQQLAQQQQQLVQLQQLQQLGLPGHAQSGQTTGQPSSDGVHAQGQTTGNDAQQASAQ